MAAYRSFSDRKYANLSRRFVHVASLFIEINNEIIKIQPLCIEFWSFNDFLSQIRAWKNAWKCSSTSMNSTSSVNPSRYKPQCGSTAFPGLAFLRSHHMYKFTYYYIKFYLHQWTRNRQLDLNNNVSSCTYSQIWNFLSENDLKVFCTRWPTVPYCPRCITRRHTTITLFFNMLKISFVLIRTWNAI